MTGSSPPGVPNWPGSAGKLPLTITKLCGGRSRRDAPSAGSSWRRASPLSDKEGANVILTVSTQASADKAVAQLREQYPQATVAGIIDWPYVVEQ